MRERWRKAGDGEKILIVLGVLTLFAIVGFGIAQLPSSSKEPRTTNSGSSGSSGGTQTPGTQTPVTTKTSPPPEQVRRAYIFKLPMKGGETPEHGEAEIDGRALPGSIFWERVSTSDGPGFCELKYECRSATYELGGKYHRFKALVGGTTTNREMAYTGHWWAVLDGEVKQGHFALNRSPQTVELSVSGVHVLELRITAETQGQEPTLVWGSAQVS
jgi:hypothetical protein